MVTVFSLIYAMYFWVACWEGGKFASSELTYTTEKLSKDGQIYINEPTLPNFGLYFDDIILKPIETIFSN